MIYHANTVYWYKPSAGVTNTRVYTDGVGTAVHISGSYDHVTFRDIRFSGGRSAGALVFIENDNAGDNQRGT